MTRATRAGAALLLALAPPGLTACSRASATSTPACCTRWWSRPRRSPSSPPASSSARRGSPPAASASPRSRPASPPAWPSAGSSPRISLLVALVAAAFIVTGLRLPPPAAAGIAALAGVTVGIDAQPESSTLLPLLVASGASLLGGTALATVVVALALGRERHWQRVAARVAASWIAASGILYFGGLLVPPSR